MTKIFTDPSLNGNEEIEKAIHLYHENPSAYSLIGVCMAIRCQIHKDGHMVFPADILEDADGQPVFSFKTLDTEDAVALVAFTSQEELQKGPQTAAVSQFIESMLEGLLQFDNIHGIMINPWGEPVYLGKEDIELILTPGSERFL